MLEGRQIFQKNILFIFIINPCYLLEPSVELTYSCMCISINFKILKKNRF